MFFLEILTFFSVTYTLNITFQPSVTFDGISWNKPLHTSFSDILSWKSIPSVAKVTQCVNASGGENVFQNRFHVKLIPLLHITQAGTQIVIICEVLNL